MRPAPVGANIGEPGSHCLVRCVAASGRICAKGTAGVGRIADGTDRSPDASAGQGTIPPSNLRSGARHLFIASFRGVASCEKQAPRAAKIKPPRTCHTPCGNFDFRRTDPAPVTTSQRLVCSHAPRAPQSKRTSIGPPPQLHPSISLADHGEASGRCDSLTPASSKDLVSAPAFAADHIHFAAVAGAAAPAMRSGGGGSVAQIGRSKDCR